MHDNYYPLNWDSPRKRLLNSNQINLWLFLFWFLFLLFYWDRFLLCSPGWHQIHDPPASACQMLGFADRHHNAWLNPWRLTWMRNSVSSLVSPCPYRSREKQYRHWHCHTQYLLHLVLSPLVCLEKTCILCFNPHYEYEMRATVISTF